MLPIGDSVKAILNELKLPLRVKSAVTMKVVRLTIIIVAGHHCIIKSDVAELEISLGGYAQGADQEKPEKHKKVLPA
jgi:hypothetical protein